MDPRDEGGRHGPAWMRAGDADRTRVVEQLGRHLVAGWLDVPEFDHRVIRAHAAVYLDELPPLLADLLPDRPPARSPERRIHRPDRVVRAAIPPVLALLAAWSAVALVHGAPPFLGVLLLVVFLRQRRWSDRW